MTETKLCIYIYRPNGAAVYLDWFSITVDYISTKPLYYTIYHCFSNFIPKQWKVVLLNHYIAKLDHF